MRLGVGGYIAAAKGFLGKKPKTLSNGQHFLYSLGLVNLFYIDYAIVLIHSIPKTHALMLRVGLLASAVYIALTISRLLHVCQLLCSPA